MFGLNQLQRDYPVVKTLVSAVTKVAIKLEEADHAAAQASGLFVPSGGNIYAQTPDGDELLVIRGALVIDAQLKREAGQPVLHIRNKRWGLDGKVADRVRDPVLAELREEFAQLDEVTGKLLFSMSFQFSFAQSERYLGRNDSQRIEELRSRLVGILAPFKRTKPKRRPQNGASQRKPRRQRKSGSKRRTGKPVETPSCSNIDDLLAFLDDIGSSKPVKVVVVVREPTAPTSGKKVTETVVGETHPIDVVAEAARKLKPTLRVISTKEELAEEPKLPGIDATKSEWDERSHEEMDTFFAANFSRPRVRIPGERSQQVVPAQFKWKAPYEVVGRGYSARAVDDARGLGRAGGRINRWSDRPENRRSVVEASTEAETEAQPQAKMVGKAA